MIVPTAVLSGLLPSTRLSIILEAADKRPKILERAVQWGSKSIGPLLTESLSKGDPILNFA
jgi:hypothetical protein